MRAPLSIVAMSSMLLVLAAGAGRASETELSSCPAEVSGNVFLSADLDCASGTSGLAAAIEMRRGRIDLRGHTITFGDSRHGISCDGTCTVVGPGTLAGGSTTREVIAGEQIHLSNLTVTGGTLGAVVPTHAKLSGVTITGSNGGVIGGGWFSITDSTLTGNALGVAAQRARIVRSTITGNAQGGVYCGNGPLILVDSTVTGNGGDSRYGTTMTCADLDTTQIPRLIRSSQCDHSHRAFSGIPGGDFGVCSLD